MGICKCGRETKSKSNGVCFVCRTQTCACGRKKGNTAKQCFYCRNGWEWGSDGISPAIICICGGIKDRRAILCFKCKYQRKLRENEDWNGRNKCFCGNVKKKQSQICASCYKKAQSSIRKDIDKIELRVIRQKRKIGVEHLNGNNRPERHISNRLPVGKRSVGPPLSTGKRKISTATSIGYPTGKNAF